MTMYNCTQGFFLHKKIISDVYLYLIIEKENSFMYFWALLKAQNKTNSFMFLQNPAINKKKCRTSYHLENV